MEPLGPQDARCVATRRSRMSAAQLSTAEPHSAMWHCPRCRGAFTSRGDGLTCSTCGCVYPVVSGIPDLRVDAPAWVDVEADRQRASSLRALVNVRSEE